MRIQANIRDISAKKERLSNWRSERTHRNLGSVYITLECLALECLALQLLNSDPTSIFVEHEGEIKEVSRSMMVNPTLDLSCKDMNLTPNEKEAILADYAESCHLRIISSPDKWKTPFAVYHPESWMRTCRDSTAEAIRDGRDTWERIAELAAKHRLNTKLNS